MYTVRHATESRPTHVPDAPPGGTQFWRETGGSHNAGCRLQLARVRCQGAWRAFCVGVVCLHARLTGCHR